ncbi:general secretion pathway protein GspK [Photobacterium sp. BZF1]|uniref:type II secretion system protein n=1 Tax=Photobacterium sp. BZF1 TaxID=1904457 RepID=UPI001653C7F0|nr:type II secretion system protein [Photobacterium sp. BZF1]MBC7002112.1 general secretion pathway protein GspK [Photobacterium sp. BZF1]
MRVQKGAILPLTLIIMAILSVLALSIVSRARDTLEFTIEQKQEFADYIAINNAMTNAVYMLSVGVPSPNAFTLPGSAEQKVYVDGRVMDFEGVQTSIQDSAGLLSLAVASHQDFYNLLRTFTSSSQAASISKDFSNWRNPKSSSSIASSGRTDEYFPRHSFMRSADELLEIPGIGQSDFFNQKEGEPGLRDYVVVGGADWYNFATMPELLISALYSLSDSQLVNLLKAREDENWEYFTQLHRSLGMYSEMPIQPSNHFLMKFHGKHYSGRAQIGITIGDLPLFTKTLWQYPDAARY